ncbi:pyridoxal-phosphate dependent enzyme [Bordetella flabilis]
MAPAAMAGPMINSEAWTVYGGPRGQERSSRGGRVRAGTARRRSAPAEACPGAMAHPRRPDCLTSRAVEQDSITFPICQGGIDERITVQEAAIASAMRAVAEAEHWMVEGAAGVALAGQAHDAQRWRGGKVAVVLCGRNIGLDMFDRAMRWHEAH